MEWIEEFNGEWKLNELSLKCPWPIFVTFGYTKRSDTALGDSRNNNNKSRFMWVLSVCELVHGLWLMTILMKLNRMWTITLTQCPCFCFWHFLRIQKLEPCRTQVISINWHNLTLYNMNCNRYIESFLKPSTCHIWIK